MEGILDNNFLRVYKEVFK
ncbi:hypothetical protein NHB30_23485 [Aneurinibacillus migulanus]|nr:hypothetical protein [Aneurinibacillus migulanus]